MCKHGGRYGKENHMLRRIDHIGIAVKDFEKSMKPYRELLDLPLNGTEEVDVQGALNKIAFFPMGDTEVELLYTTAPTGLIADHIRDHGEGIHHIAFEVDDIDAWYERLKKKGTKIMWDKVIPGSRGTRILFFEPEEFNGVHIELLQYPKKDS